MVYMSDYERSRYPSSHPRFTGTSWISPEEQRRQYDEYNSERNRNSNHTTTSHSNKHSPYTKQDFYELLLIIAIFIIIIVICRYTLLFLYQECLKYQANHPELFRERKYRNVHPHRRF